MQKPRLELQGALEAHVPLCFLEATPTSFTQASPSVDDTDTTKASDQGATLQHLGLHPAGLPELCTGPGTEGSLGRWMALGQ